MPTRINADNLDLSRCPHCRVAGPLLRRVHHFESTMGSKEGGFLWAVFVCSRCAKPVLGGCASHEREIRMDLIFPMNLQVHESLPSKARNYLQQAIESLHAPAGAIMLCASSVDAMLKEKGMKTGSLYRRIEDAAAQHLITSGMAEWAHAVRLDANDERHADDSAELPTSEDAKRAIDFTRALGEFLFILPARISEGLRKPPAAK